MNPSPFPSRETRATQREEKRLALLQAAVRLFNERGFHATSLEDVAASLGVTKPVVYHYLGTKDQVLFECVRIGLEQLKQAVESSADLPGSGLDRLEFALRRYAEINMEDFGACVVRTGDTLLSPQSRAQFRTLKRANNAALQALVQAAADDGSAMVCRGCAARHLHPGRRPQLARQLVQGGWSKIAAGRGAGHGAGSALRPEAQIAIWRSEDVFADDGPAPQALLAGTHPVFAL